VSNRPPDKIIAAFACANRVNIETALEPQIIVLLPRALCVRTLELNSKNIQ
jgi:hypothetical protein